MGNRVSTSTPSTSVPPPVASPRASSCRQPQTSISGQALVRGWPERERAAEHAESARSVVRNRVRVGRFEGESAFEQRGGAQCVLRVQRQGCPRCTGGECRHVRRQKNRRRVRSGLDVPSKIHGASAPEKVDQVSARAASERPPREEEGTHCSRAFESRPWACATVMQKTYLDAF